MQVGTTKDQGLYNMPSAAVHPGTLAARTLPQYNTIQGLTQHEYTIIYIFAGTRLLIFKSDNCGQSAPDCLGNQRSSPQSVI